MGTEIVTIVLSNNRSLPFVFEVQAVCHYIVPCETKTLIPSAAGSVYY